jgi:hypothetical protein
MARKMGPMLECRVGQYCVGRQNTREWMQESQAIVEKDGLPWSEFRWFKRQASNISWLSAVTPDNDRTR